MQISRYTPIADILLFALMLSAVWFFIDRYSYVKAYPIDRPKTISCDTLLQIGIIEDSWVAGKRMDSLVWAGLKEHGFKLS